MVTFLKKIWQRIRYWFWIKPVSRPEPLKATDVINQYVVIEYKGQKINLRKTELLMFENLSRQQKRAMARKFEIMEKKGQIRFEEINGKLTAIRNKNYEEQANIRQLRTDQIRQGQRSN
jgi:predicted HD phosphohydrolase